MSKKMKQAGVLPWRKKGKRVEVLLVTRRRSGDWFIPKGNIEKGMSPCQAARKEAVEEAGVMGKAKARSMGEVMTTKRGKKVEVSVYPMQVTRVKSHWDEDDQRKRRWFDLKQARKRVNEDDLSKLIRELADRV